MGYLQHPPAPQCRVAVGLQADPHPAQLPPEQQPEEQLQDVPQAQLGPQQQVVPHGHAAGALTGAAEDIREKAIADNAV